MRKPTNARQQLLDWHRDLAGVVGAVSLAIEGKGVKRRQLEEWSKQLHRVATAMQQTANPPVVQELRF